MGRVEGKVVIVTGGASGLGEADAEQLAIEGAHVILTDINEAGQAVADRIGGTFIRHDATSEENWKSVIDTVMDRFGKLDAVVNNAGGTQTKNIEVATLEDMRRMYQLNVESVFLGCKYGMAAMLKSGVTGSLINISSMGAIRGFPEVCAYSTSKGAVLALSRNVAAHCFTARYPIRVNTILPGTTVTPMQQQTQRDRAGQATVGMDEGRRRYGKPADIAHLVVYLASDESVQVMGQEFVVDGGYSIM